MSDLAEFVAETPMVDTHEHQQRLEQLNAHPPDILTELFHNYMPAVLRVAGATPAALRRLADTSDRDVAGRFAAVAEVWKRAQWTGYGEALRLSAKACFGLEELTEATLADAQSQLAGPLTAERRLAVLRDQANLDHVQINELDELRSSPQPVGTDFFLFDMSWASMSRGTLPLNKLAEAAGREVVDLASLADAIEAVFDRDGPTSIAVKSQHAYHRTIAWQKRSDSDAAAVLAELLAGGPDSLTVERRNLLGDWCLARGVEQAQKHNLPFKIHTGYQAGDSYMELSWLRPSLLTPLLRAYPEARFVLMHMGYPYEDEMASLAQHYPNVWVDLCWAWAMNPLATARLVRRFIHAAPANKLFVFGGDTFRPWSTVGFAMQARRWLTRALQAEIDSGDLTEVEAIALAERFMRANQHDCFDLAATREAMRECLAAPSRA